MLFENLGDGLGRTRTSYIGPPGRYLQDYRQQSLLQRKLHAL